MAICFQSLEAAIRYKQITTLFTVLANFTLSGALKLKTVLSDTNPFWTRINLTQIFLFGGYNCTRSLKMLPLISPDLF